MFDSRSIRTLEGLFLTWVKKKNGLYLTVFSGYDKKIKRFVNAFICLRIYIRHSLRKSQTVSIRLSIRWTLMFV